MGIDVRRALLHWVAYSAEARNPLRLPAFCFRACGVLAEYGGVVVRLPIGLRSLTLLRCLSRYNSLVLCLRLTLQVMAPKAYLTGKSQAKVAAKKTRKKFEGPCLRRCWAELHGWSFTRSYFWGWTLAQNQASLDWASSVYAYSRRGSNRIWKLVVSSSRMSS